MLRFGPNAYRQASAERRDDAERLLNERRYVLSMYTSGVAAECMLRALRGLRDAQFDERHDLREICKNIGRLGLLTSPQDDTLLKDVSTLQAIWRNNLRFASTGQVEKFLTKLKKLRYSGRNRLFNAAKDLYEAAASVVARGEVIWHRSKRN